MSKIGEWMGYSEKESKKKTEDFISEKLKGKGRVTFLYLKASH